MESGSCCDRAGLEMGAVLRGMGSGEGPGKKVLLLRLVYMPETVGENGPETAVKEARVD